MFLGLPDPHPDPLGTSTDTAQDPSIIKHNSKKNLDFYCFVTSLTLLSLQNDENVLAFRSGYGYVFGPPGSAFGSVSQRYGSEDPHPHPYQKMLRIRNTEFHTFSFGVVAK
jgi:hypothetical protein